MVDAAQEFAQLQLRFVDELQQRYEVIRPLILFEDGTATQRAQETQRHPETVPRHGAPHIPPDLVVAP